MNEALITRLGALDLSLQDDPKNKHDRAHVLINACIAEGIVHGSHIVDVLAGIGFNRRHIGMTLKQGIQRNPVWPHWGRHEDGTYYAPGPT